VVPSAPSMRAQSVLNGAHTGPASAARLSNQTGDALSSFPGAEMAMVQLPEGTRRQGTTSSGGAASSSGQSRLLPARTGSRLWPFSSLQSTRPEDGVPLLGSSSPTTDSPVQPGRAGAARVPPEPHTPRDARRGDIVMIGPDGTPVYLDHEGHVHSMTISPDHAVELARRSRARNSDMDLEVVEAGTGSTTMLFRAKTRAELRSQTRAAAARLASSSPAVLMQMAPLAVSQTGTSGSCPTLPAQGSSQSRAQDHTRTAAEDMV
jgi:hypothetical protein